MTRTGIFPRMFCALGTVVSLAVGNVAAQGDRFETKVPFKLDQSLNLDAKVGPVRIARNLDHAILEYVVPLIADVRITLNGRLD